MTKSKVIEKIKFYATEKIEILPIRRTPKGHKYAVTNHGRVIRFGKDPAADGVLVKATVDVPFNYERVYIQNNGKRTSVLVHRLVAQFFLPKPEKGQLFIIHKDRNNRNNHPSNLKWVTKEEHVRHAMAGENWKKGRQSRSQVYKLTEDRVRLIRKKISEGKTRMKMIAKQFKVSEMQIYRIQSGENWGWVK